MAYVPTNKIQSRQKKDRKYKKFKNTRSLLLNYFLILMAIQSITKSDIIRNNNCRKWWLISAPWIKALLNLRDNLMTFLIKILDIQRDWHLTFMNFVIISHIEKVANKLYKSNKRRRKTGMSLIIDWTCQKNWRSMSKVFEYKRRM